VSDTPEPLAIELDQDRIAVLEVAVSDEESGSLGVRERVLAGV